MSQYGAGPRGYGGGPPRLPGLPEEEEQDLYGLRLEDFLPPEQIQPEMQPVSRGDQILALLGQSMQGTEMPAPQGFGQGLLSGLFRGLGGEGLRRQGERQKLDQAAQQRAQARNAANLEASRAYRTARVGAVQERGKEARAGATKQADYERDNPKLTAEMQAASPILSRLPLGTPIPRAWLKPEAPANPEREPLVAIEGPNGPVYVRRSDAEGKSPPQPGLKPKPPSAAERGELVGDIGTLGQVRDIRAAFKAKFVGPFSGAYGAVTQRVGLGKREGEAKLRSRLAGMRNQILKLRSGGAVSEGEAARLLEELPTTQDPSDTFIEKLDNFESVYRQVAEARRSVLSGTGVDLGGIPDLPASGEVVRGPDGKLVMAR